MKNKIFLYSILVCFLTCTIGCSSEDSNTGQTVSTPTPPLPQLNNYYGAWSGSLISKLDGSTESVSIIINGSQVFISNNYGFTASGNLSGTGDEGSATLTLYKHFPADMLETIRNPAIGFKTNNEIKLTLQLNDSIITGTYQSIESGIIKDTGDVTALFIALSELPPTVIGITGTYFNHEFYCDVTGTQSLYCYSYLSLTLNSSLEISGEYSDKFFYATRPPGIPSGIPSSFSFAGSITPVPENNGIYVVKFNLPTYGDLVGIGWVYSSGLMQYVSFSGNDDYSFRIE